MSAEVVLTGLEAPEGPVRLADGDIAFVEQLRGQVSRWNAGGLSVVSRGPGAPNSIVLGSDGCLYAAQNGGVVDDWRADVRASPSIQRISMDGGIQTVALEAEGRALKAPNDLVFGPDTRLYVTDPSEAYAPQNPREHARICSFGAAGGLTVVETGPTYPNGLAFLADGRLIWVESYTRRVRTLDDDGLARTLAVLPEGHVPDGMAVAEDGRMFIATVTSGGVTVLGPDGTYLGLLALDDRANPTNLCFDGSALRGTDFGAGYRPGAGDGRLWRVETDAQSGPIYTGALSS
jgi:gluconolactonase